MMSREEMREIVDAGLHNDTYFEKQDRERTRKEGYKIWGIDEGTARPYIVDRGYETEEEAREFIASQSMQGRWFFKPASEDDPDYYSSGEKGFWTSMSDDEYQYFSDYTDNGGTIY